MNILTEPLHWNDKLCLKGYMYNLALVCTTAVTGKQMFNCTTQMYKDHPIVLSKGTAVARMVTANEVPRTVVADGTGGAL